MSILKFFKNHIPTLIVVVALLAVQANCELSLPQYMSDIVNVGIGQGGIPSGVFTKVSAQTLADLEMFMDDDDVALVEAAYGEPNSSGVRTYAGDPADTDADSDLAQALALPETVAYSLAQGVDASTLGEEYVAILGEDATLDLETVRMLYDAGYVTRDQLVDATQAIAESMGTLSDTIVESRAVEFVELEYTSLGIDLDDIMADYLQDMASTMILYCVGALLSAVAVGLIASRTATAIARDTRRDLFAHVMSFSPAEVDKFSQASLITRCTNDVQQVQGILVMAMRMMLLAPVMGVTAILKVADANSGLEWAIVAVVLALLGLMVILYFVTMPKFKIMQRLVDRVNLVAREMLDGLMPIRAFGREEHELERFDDASTDLMRTQLFTNHAMALMMPVMTLILNVFTILIVWFGSGRISDGLLQVGDMMAFISYTMQIVMSFLILAMVAIMLPRSSVAADRIFEVLDCPLSITDPEDPETPAEDAPRGELAFHDVSFAYPGAEGAVVEGVSFEVSAGQMLGIVGSTGSGKTTVVQLIPRLYDVTAGSVTLDGVDVRRMTLSDLRGRIGYVPQQGRLFSGTVASNVAFADEGMSGEKVARAVRVSQAQEFVDEMPEGTESAISQGGTNVSGGQRQRLAIARALANEPEVLVLDDSFSALDYATDAKLRRALAEEAADAAVVVVAQRVASVMHADRIIVLDGGHVVGDGTHEELLRSCPEYLEIATSQLSEEELGLKAQVLEFPGASRGETHVPPTDDPVPSADCAPSPDAPEGGER